MRDDGGSLRTAGRAISFGSGATESPRSRPAKELSLTSFLPVILGQPWGSEMALRAFGGVHLRRFG